MEASTRVVGTAFVLLSFALLTSRLPAADSLPPLAGNRPPQNLDELWAGYDPAAEPLEVEVVHTWQRGDAAVRMLVYTVGTFTGRKSRMGAYYAFPAKRAGKVPGILQLHGGGQRARSEMVEAAAANGYACISINWGGKPMADQHQGDPGTDWGAVDATQDGHNSHYGSLAPDDKTLDAVVSPRNNNWFLIVLAARRAMTFLQQQQEVDPERLGVTGHSMGGKLTVMTAGIDPRVKAAVPSCGGTAAAPNKLRLRPGSSCRPVNPEPLYHKTIDDINSIRRIKCPILYTGPQNDFNGILDNLYANWRQMPSRSVHYSISPHFNHRHISESEFAGRHFFDVILKGEGTFPKTPQIDVALKADDGIPEVTLQPDNPDDVVKVHVYYSVDPHCLTRFWRTATATRSGNAWSAKCPVISTDMPLFVMANVYYPLEKQITGPAWNRRSPETFVVSSRGLDFDPPDLKAAGVVATDKPERLIQADFHSWQDWYRLQIGNDHHRQYHTRKIKDPKWRGPDGAKLTIDVLDPNGGEFTVLFAMNSWRAYQGMPTGRYYASKPIARTDGWQAVEIGLEDLKPMDERSREGLRSWQYMTEFGILAMARTKRNGEQVVLAGAPWPKPRKFRNLRWVGGKYPKQWIMPGLSTIWACQAGKHVYVEKPLSHYIWEGRQMVNAARTYDRIVETGTQRRSQRTGICVQCEGGHLNIPACQAYDEHGKCIKTFSGGEDHFENFIAAVRNGNRNGLRAEVADGHLSTAICHTGNISYRLGRKATRKDVLKQAEGAKGWGEMVDRLMPYLKGWDIDPAAATITLGPWLAVDPKTETFQDNPAANALARGWYRRPYLVPDLSSRKEGIAT